MSVETKTTDMTCIVCPIGCQLSVALLDNGDISVTGNSCNRGITYGKQEFTAPVRIVTTSVRVNGGVRPVASVKTEKPISKSKIQDVLTALRELSFTAPVHAGEIVLKDVGGSGADVIFTASVAPK